MAGEVLSDKKYRCSCGAAFRFESSLRRHRAQLGCDEADDSSATNPPERELPNAPAEAAKTDGIDEPVLAGEPPLAALTPAPLWTESLVRAPAPAPFWGPLLLEFVDFVLQTASRSLDWLARTLRRSAELAGTIAAGAVGLWLIMHSLSALAQTRTHRPVPTAAPRTQHGYPQRLGLPAEKAVADFFTHLQKKDPSSAYALLSPGWAGQLPYPRFSAGYQRSQHRECRILGSRWLDRGQVEVSVLVDVVEAGRPVRYQGKYLVVASARGWKLDEGWLQPAPADLAWSPQR
ncbi:MAG: hypothetical protein HY319_25875 [Armatimonadetes bacterium]|nr:hypothetical protein [Armatimonadota bacterium]